jgi:hypothetical protein
VKKMQELLHQKLKQVIFKKMATRDVGETRKALALHLGIHKAEFTQIEQELVEINVIERLPGGRAFRDPTRGLLP